MSEPTNIYAHWSKIHPPARPSADVVRYVSESLATGSRVLILGCTPEFRTVCHQKNCDVVVLDKSRTVFENVTPMVQTMGQETFIEESWQEFSSELKFDYILGHGSLSMVGFDTAQEILRNLTPMLKMDGSCILQIHTYRTPAFSSVSEVVKHWYETSRENLFTNTWFEIGNLVNDLGFGGFNYVSWKKRLIQENKTGALSSEDLEGLMKPLTGHDIDIFMHNEDKFTELTHSLFDEVMKYHAKDYHGSEMHPIFHGKGTHKLHERP